MFVVVVNFMLDERADLFASVLAGGNVREVMNYRGNLLIQSLLKEGHRLGRKSIGKCCVALAQVVEAARKELNYFLFKLFIVDQFLKTLFDEVNDFDQRFVVYGFVDAPRQQFIDLTIDEARDGAGSLFASAALRRCTRRACIAVRRLCRELARARLRARRR